MNEIPDDFSELEARVAGRRGTGVGLPAPLRERVLLAVNAELKPSKSPYWFAAGLAASVLVGLNLSIISASATRFMHIEPAPATEVAATVALIRQVAPELPAADAQRLAAMEISASLPINAGVPADFRGLPRYLEQETLP